VGVDGAGAEEELGGCLLAGGAGRDEPCDLEFLGCELLGAAGLALAGGFAACPELAAGVVGPGLRAEPFEEVEGSAQALSRLPAVMQSRGGAGRL